MSTSALPPGTCGTHGWHGMTMCPRCSNSAGPFTPLVAASSWPDGRDPACVERWPECEEGTYDPRCCRFPKSCSCRDTAVADWLTAPSSRPATRLHRKYEGLRRTSDGSEVEGWYFVIRADDRAGEVALLAYADACESYAPELAADLRQRVRDERLVRGLYEAGWER